MRRSFSNADLAARYKNEKNKSMNRFFVPYKADEYNQGIDGKKVLVL